MPNDETSSTAGDKRESHVEYSAREVCPQSLLLQVILRAHSIFLLHHTPTLAELFGRLPRARFCGLLEGFWGRFIRDWDVLLHGNPAVDIYNGLKLAAGGELGIGVGEEEWGSGEREVLEGFIGRTDGLVDMVVSRFGDVPRELDRASDPSIRTASVSTGTADPWLGKEESPRSSDGVIFSGIGALSRQSIKDVSAWVEWLYKYGQDAYGVKNNPWSTHGQKRRKVTPLKDSSDLNSPANPISNIPPPIVTATSQSLRNPPSNTRPSGENKPILHSTTISPTNDESSVTGTETLMKYLTLGVYGSSWGIPIKRSEPHSGISNPRQPENRGLGDKRVPSSSDTLQHIEPKVAKSSPTERNATSQDTGKGCFIIGLQGNLDDEDLSDDEDNGTETGVDQEPNFQRGEWNRRTSLRFLHVHRVRSKGEDSTGSFTSSLSLLDSPLVI